MRKLIEDENTMNEIDDIISDIEAENAGGIFESAESAFGDDAMLTDGAELADGTELEGIEEDFSDAVDELFK